MKALKKQNDNRKSVLKSAAWFVEALARLAAGQIIINNFDHIATTALALYFIATGGIIVIAHFWRANQ